MNRHLVWMGIFLGFVGVLFFCLKTGQKEVWQEEIEPLSDGVHSSRINQTQMAMILPPNERTKEFQENNILGGVVPHHLVAAPTLAEFFSLLAKSKSVPRTIVLIGPNHYERGKGRVLSGRFDWETPFGKLEADEHLVDLLVANELAVIDEETLGGEHAIYAAVLFLKYFLPEAKIVPLVVSGRLSLEESLVLGEKLAELVDEKTIFVGSIDFSHYLSSEDSKRKDQETLQAIRAKDYSQIASFGDDHVDSPPSLLVVLSFLEKRAVNYSWEVIRQTDAGSILGRPNAPGTSHFELIFFDNH